MTISITQLSFKSKQFTTQKYIFKNILQIECSYSSFSNYVGFDEIKSLCAFTKYTTKKVLQNHNLSPSVDINSV